MSILRYETNLLLKVSEENRDKAQELRGEASELQGQGGIFYIRHFLISFYL